MATKVPPSLKHKYVTVPEAAEAIGKSESAVWYLLRLGELIGFKYGGRRLVTKASVHEYLKPLRDAVD